MDLDQEQTLILRHMKTPVLESLSLDDNFIVGQELFDWISPALTKLKSLDLSNFVFKKGGNALTDEAVCNLTRMKFASLSNINLANNRKLTAQSLECLAEYNSSLLTHLDISGNLATEKSLRKLFEGKSFENLEELKMMKMQNSKNLFQFLNWKSMKRLRMFDLMDTDLSKRVDTILKNKVMFPELKVWRFGGGWCERQDMDKMLRNLTRFGPKLQLFEIMIGDANDRGGYINISSLNFKTVPQGTYIVSREKMTIWKPWGSTKFEIIEIMSAMAPKELETMGFLETMFDNSFIGYKFMPGEAYDEKRIIIDEALFRKVLGFLKEKADFFRIEVVKYVHPDDFFIFLNLWKNQSDVGNLISIRYFAELNGFVNEKQDIPQGIELPYLRQMTYQPSVIFYDKNQFMYLYNTFKSPFWDNVMISSESVETNPNFPRFANLFLRRNSNLNILYLLNNQLSCDDFNKIFENVRLPFLTHFQINQNQLSSDCIFNFIEENSLIKYLDLSDNSNLTAPLTEVLLESNLVLETLQISNLELENQEFSKLAFFKTEFLLQFQADGVQINQNSIIWLMGNSTLPPFPKLFSLSLNHNYYANSGFSALFSQKMPFLNQLYFYYLEDPKTLAKILLYPTQMDFFALSEGSLTNLDSIDPRALRHATAFELNLKDFTLKDFQILNTMDLIHLQKVNLQIMNVNDCEILKYILKIVKNVEHFSLQIKNLKSKDKPLNDNCINRHSTSDGVYFTRLRSQSVEFPKEKFYLPNFFSYIFSNYLAEKDEIDFSNHYFTDEIMLELLVGSIGDQVVRLDFNKNYLTDVFVQKIFKNPLNEIVQIDLHQNQIELINVPSLIRKYFPKLKKLNLGKNEITDEGIDTLIQANFPELEELSLESCDITVDGFIKLMQLKAPKLKKLGLQNTMITEWDLVYIAEFVELGDFPANLQVETKLEILYTNRERIDKMLMEKYGVLSIELKYEAKHLKEKNKAIFETD